MTQSVFRSAHNKHEVNKNMHFQMKWFYQFIMEFIIVTTKNKSVYTFLTAIPSDDVI